MAESSIYSDIAARTDGAFLLGVVGPVRTGKSSFIKRFMETLVIPHIENTYMRERARDELPQSGSGRTIMTAEPNTHGILRDELRLCSHYGSAGAALRQLIPGALPPIGVIDVRDYKGLHESFDKAGFSGPDRTDDSQQERTVCPNGNIAVDR